MMKLAVLASSIAASSAFTSQPFAPMRTALHATEEATTVEESLDLGRSLDEVSGFGSSEEAAVDEPVDPAVAPINGWVPDESLPCYGLPGAVAPTGYFDPLGFAQAGITLNEVKRNREAEVMHGRVAMIATLGYLVGEQLPSPFGITGPANDQLQQVPLPAFILLTAAIGTAEIKRAQRGWVEPDFGNWSKTLFKLRENYYPGDLGFDPLGLKPTDPKEFATMQTKELQNGRLAMIMWTGMCAQELCNHRTLIGTIEFYQKVFAGVNPYEGCGDGVIC